LFKYVLILLNQAYTANLWPHTYILLVARNIYEVMLRYIQVCSLGWNSERIRYIISREYN